MSDVSLDRSNFYASPAAAKWSRRQTAWFVIASSAALWGAIIWTLWQLF